MRGSGQRITQRRVHDPPARRPSGVIRVPEPDRANPPESTTQRTWERYGAWLWLIGIVQFAVVMLVVEIAFGCGNFGGCYSPWTNPISDLGSGGFVGTPSYFTYQGLQHPWPYSQLWPLFDYSIFVFGAFLYAGVFLLQSAFPRTRTARASLGLVGLAALAAAGVGVIPEDTLLDVHLGFAVITFAAAGAAVLLMAFAFDHDRSWGRGWAGFSWVAGGGSAGALFLLVVAYSGVVPEWPVYGSGFGVGGLERVILAFSGVWIFCVSLRVLHRRRTSRHPLRYWTAAGPMVVTPAHEDAAARRRWENYGAWIVLLGLVQFVAVMVASQFAFSCGNSGGCYNIISNPISDFGSAGFATGNPSHVTYLGLSLPWPTALLWPLFNFSIMLFGVSLLAGAILVRSAFPRTNWSGFALFLLAVGGMGAAGVGIVPEDTLLAAHAYFALIAFGLAALGVLALGIALAIDRSWGRSWSAYTLASGLFALPVVVIFTVPSLVGVSAWAPYGSVLGYGGMERLILVAPLLWLGVAMVHLLARPGRRPIQSVPGHGPEPSVK